jgi:hypothetical protein
MSDESDSDRQQQWVLSVRRSFGISDLVGDEDARKEIVRCFEERLRENGWQIATRAISDPLVDAMMVMGASGDLDDLFVAEQSVSAATSPTRDAAHRVIDRGLEVVDPEHLAFAVRSGHPPEIVTTAASVLYQVRQYMREHPYGD